MGGLIRMLLAAKQNAPIRRLVLNGVGAFVPWSAPISLKGHLGKETSFAPRAEAEAYFCMGCAELGPLDDAYRRHLAEHSVKQRGKVNTVLPSTSDFGTSTVFFIPGGKPL